MAKILVTGANGFIASHLLPVLHQANHQIIGSTRQLSTSFSSEQFTSYCVGEIDADTNWQDLLSGVDVVIHLAARAHVLKDLAIDPEQEFYRVNVEGTHNLARQSQSAGVKQFIFISSIGAMASQSDEVLTEQSSCDPDTFYGRSKLEAEQQLRELAQNSTMSWTIIRPPLVFGRGNPGNMARLLKLVRLGLPLPFALVHNRRSFVFVGNLVSAIARCIEAPQAYNQLFLISDGQDLSTPELIVQIAKPQGLQPRLLPIPLQLLRQGGDLANLLQSLLGKTLPLNRETVDRLLDSLYVDNSYIQTTLDWSPPFTVEQGFEQMFRGESVDYS